MILSVIKGVTLCFKATKHLDYFSHTVVSIKSLLKSDTQFLNKLTHIQIYVQMSRLQCIAKSPEQTIILFSTIKG